MLIFVLGCAAPREDAGGAPVAAHDGETPDAAPPDTTPSGKEPTLPPDPASGEFDFPFDGALHRFAIELGEFELQSLRDAPEEEVPGRFIWEGEVYEPVSIRLKGNGSFQPVDEKPSFKIQFDAYEKELDFHGLERIVLNNMSNDATQLHERVAHRVYRAAGVPDVRASHGVVSLNGAEYGLYSVVENIDQDFLERWYSDASGSMWEMFDVDFRPEEIASFEHEEGLDDRAVLRSIAEVLREPNEGDWLALAPYIDEESFLTYFAVSAVIGQFDAYPYSWPGDDIHLYLDPEDGRIDFIPHGTDETWEDPERPITFVYGMLAVACLDDDACEARFEARTAEILALTEQLDVLGYVSELQQALSGAIAGDLRRGSTTQDVEAAWEGMEAFIRGRADAL